MHEFQFPTNIKQIGSITTGIKIYMEDYVCTYLQQYAESAGYDEKLAVLVGRKMVIDGQKILFISGAVQAKYTKQIDNIETLTAESWEYIHEQMFSYFENMDILGWMQSQPGYGVYLNVNYANYHMDTFKESHHVMFVVDPIERTNAFFIPNGSELVEAKGYFIYYDKNKNMHEYMIQNRIRKLKVAEEEAAPEDVEEENPDPDKALLEKIALSMSKPKRTESKRLINMLVSLSALLLVICFIMGIGLIQNEDRITRLESSLSDLSTAYNNAISQIKSGGSEPVFAAQNDVIAEPTPAVLIEENGNELLATVPLATAPLATAPLATVPLATPTPTPPTALLTVPETYVVESGDNLRYISLHFYGTIDMVSEIMAINDLSDPDKIFYGKVLKLPTPKN